MCFFNYFVLDIFICFTLYLYISALILSVLSSNEFTGALPATLAKLTNLTDLWVHSLNTFICSFFLSLVKDDHIINVFLLEVLYDCVYRTSFYSLLSISWFLPLILLHCPWNLKLIVLFFLTTFLLVFLSLRYNSTTNSLYNCWYIRRISDNNFTGKIPKFISNWTKIEKL